MPSRRVAALLCMTALTAPAARAQPYPNKPVRAASCCVGIVEAITRQVAEEMSPILKQPIVVESKPGASGSIAADHVARSKADGYTIFFGTNSTHAANQSLFKSLCYDYVKDFAPIGGIGEGALVLVVSSNSPLTSVPSLTTEARKEPGRLSYGWASSSTRMSMELLNQLANIRLRDVPHKMNPQLEARSTSCLPTPTPPCP